MEFYRPDPCLSAIIKVYLRFVISIFSKGPKGYELTVDNYRKILGPSNPLYKFLEQVTSLQLNPHANNDSCKIIPGNELFRSYQSMNIQKSNRVFDHLIEDFNEVKELYNLSQDPRTALKQLTKQFQLHLQQKKQIVIVETEVGLNDKTEFYTPDDQQIHKIKKQLTQFKIKQHQDSGACYLLAPLISLMQKYDLAEMKSRRISDAITIHYNKDGSPSGQLTVVIYYCGIKHVVHMTTRLPRKIDNGGTFHQNHLGAAYIEKALAIVFGNSYEFFQKHQLGEYSSTGFSIVYPTPSYLVKQEDLKRYNYKSCFTVNHLSKCHCFALTSNCQKKIDPIHPDISKTLNISPNQRYSITRADLSKYMRTVIELIEPEKPRYEYLSRFDLYLEVKEPNTYFFLNLYQMSKIMTKLRLWAPTACLVFIIDNETNVRIKQQSFICSQSSDCCLKIGPEYLKSGKYTIVALIGVTAQRMPSRIEVFSDKQITLGLIDPISPLAQIDRIELSGGYSHLFQSKRETNHHGQKVKEQKLKGLKLGSTTIKLDVLATYCSCLLRLKINPCNTEQITIHQLFYKLFSEETHSLTYALTVQLLQKKIVFDQSQNHTVKQWIEVFYFVAPGISEYILVKDIKAKSITLQKSFF